MVMAGQFESLLHPFLILFSMPFAGSGVAIALWATGTPLCMTAYIGIILLVFANRKSSANPYIVVLTCDGSESEKKACPSAARRVLEVTFDQSGLKR